MVWQRGEGRLSRMLRRATNRKKEQAVRRCWEGQNTGGCVIDDARGERFPCVHDLFNAHVVGLSESITMRFTDGKSVGRCQLTNGPGPAR
jgi:hypothetical protein